MAFLEMKNIVKRFGGTFALNGVSLSLNRGEIHALLGGNGAGKSTLMKILVGATQPDAGHISLDGTELKLRSTIDARRYGIVEIFQELTILPELSVAENIFLTREIIHGCSGLLNRTAMNELAAKLLSQIMVNVDVTRKAGTFSIAQQQMFEIVRALSCKARVLILDEPTSCLTPGETQALFGVLRRIVANGTTVIYISHRMNEILEIASRGTIMRDGNVVTTMDISRETDPAEIVRHMTGQRWDGAVLRRRSIGEQPMLRIRNLARRGALHDISLTVNRGEVLGIFGLVGAGRTELARAIFGADRFDSGTIELDGKPFRPRSCRHAMQSGIALVPEDRKKEGVLAQLSVEHNLTITVLERLSRLGILRPRLIGVSCEKLMRRLELKASSARWEAYRLSGGNQQKLVVAKWMARRSKVFLFDEPTRGVDVRAKREIHVLIRELAAEGCGVVLISSESEEILANSDRIVVMRAGRICTELAADSATDQSLMFYATGSESVISEKDFDG